MGVSRLVWRFVRWLFRAISRWMCARLIELHHRFEEEDYGHG